MLAPSEVLPATSMPHAAPRSRFQKEQILRSAGVAFPPYPSLKGAIGSPAAAEYLAQCDAWEIELDRRYVEHLQRQERAIRSVKDYVDVAAKEGIAAVLVELNRRVPHRYTAVYRLDDGQLLRNVELVDKSNELRPEFLAEVPLETSFCQFVLRQGRFRTDDSSLDDRLNGHPYKGVMMAYHGVPVVDDGGSLIGTLCHFDVQRQPFTDEEFAHIEAVAKVIHPYLPR
jgi:GAF domain-containing protein